MNVLDVLATILFVLAIVNVASTVVLVAAAWRHHWPALEERATVAVILAAAAICGAILGLNRLHVLSLNTEQSLAVLALALILISVPSLVWLAAFLIGRFDGDEP